MTTYQKWCLVSNRKGLFLWIVWSIIRISLADQLSSSLNTTSDPLSNTFASSNSSTVNQFNTITNVKSSLTSSGNSLLPNALNASLATSNTSRVLMANTSLVDEVSFNICSVRCEQCTPSTSDCTAICGPLFECAHRNSSQNITYILKRFYCDAICDCDDCSDEIKCALDKCQPDETMCQDKSRCIKPSQVCDGRFDCKDYSDELGCVDTKSCLASGRFSCNLDLCIDMNLVCDGRPNCPDGKDEQNCTCKTSEYQCANGECVDGNRRCDFVQDCKDASDEWGCVQVDTAQILLKQLPGLGRFGVVCASDSFDAVIANETCRQMGQGWAESYGSVPLQASHLPWVQMQQSALWSSWYDPISHISTANLSLAEDSMSEFKKRIKLTNECPNQLAQTITCASFECSSGSSTRYTNSAKTGTPNDVQSLVRIRVDSSDGRSTECLAQLISPDWLLSSAECLEDTVAPNKATAKLIMSNNQELMNITIDRVVTHAHKSKYQSWYVRDFDLSLARLSRPIRLKDNFAEPICLPKEPIDSDITCFMTIPDVPEPISFIVTESNTCNAPHHYNNTILGHNFCALLQPDSISNDDKSPVVVVNEKSPGISANSSCADMLSSISHKSINIDYRLPEFAAGSPLICLSRHSQWFVAGFINFIDSRPRSLRHPAVFVNNFALRSFVDRVTGMTRYRRPLSYPVVAYKLVSNTTQSNHSISTNYNQLNQSIDSVYQLLANANATLLPSSPTSSMTVVEHGAITLLTSSNQRSISFPLSNQTHNAWMTLNTSINSNLPNHSITQSNNSIAFITHNSTDSTTLGQHPLVNSANSTL